MTDIKNLVIVKDALIETVTINVKEISFSIFGKENNEEVENIINDIFIKAVNNKSDVLRKEMIKILKKEHKEEFKIIKQIRKSKYFGPLFDRYVKL